MIVVQYEPATIKSFENNLCLNTLDGQDLATARMGQTCLTTAIHGIFINLDYINSCRVLLVTPILLALQTICVLPAAYSNHQLRDHVDFKCMVQLDFIKIPSRFWSYEVNKLFPPSTLHSQPIFPLRLEGLFRGVLDQLTLRWVLERWSFKTKSWPNELCNPIIDLLPATLWEQQPGGPKLLSTVLYNFESD